MPISRSPRRAGGSGAGAGSSLPDFNDDDVRMPQLPDVSSGYGGVPDLSDDDVFQQLDASEIIDMDRRGGGAGFEPIMPSGPSGVSGDGVSERERMEAEYARRERELERERERERAEAISSAASSYASGGIGDFDEQSRPDDYSASGEVDEHGTVNVDEKRKLLNPFGDKRNRGKRGKGAKPKRVKVAQFDKRKNKAIGAKVVSGATVFVVLAVLGLGTYNAVFPDRGLSQEQVRAIASEVADKNGFPKEEAESLSKEFIRAYLTTGPESDALLNYFYSGGDRSNVSVNRVYSGDFKQSILYGPSVYRFVSKTPQTGSVVVGALVEDSIPKVNEDSGSGKFKGHWVFFSVDVYYDKASSRMFIAPDSPNLIPNYVPGDAAKLPEAKELGSEAIQDEKIVSDASTTIFGYIDGFAKSSRDNHAAVDQYIFTGEGANVSELSNGLNGAYSPEGGEASKSTKIQFFKTDYNDFIRAKVVVTWVRNAGTVNGVPNVPGSENVQSTYVSTYDVVLKNNGGKWLVGKFKPMYYEPKSD